MCGKRLRWRERDEDATMAKVWLVYEGDRPTIGDARAERTLAECVELLRITRDCYLGNDEKQVRINPDSRLGTVAGYRHVVVEIEAGEAGGSWKEGYYHSPLSPTEALKALGLNE